MKFIVKPTEETNYAYCFKSFFCSDTSGCTSVCSGNCNAVCSSHCGNVGGTCNSLSDNSSSTDKGPFQPKHIGKGGMFGPGGLFG